MKILFHFSKIIWETIDFFLLCEKKIDLKHGIVAQI